MYGYDPSPADRAINKIEDVLAPYERIKAYLVEIEQRVSAIETKTRALSKIIRRLENNKEDTNNGNQSF